MKDALKTSQLISDKKDKVIWALNKHTNSISCRPPPGVYGTLQLSKDIQGVQASFKLVTMQYWSVSNPKVARTPCSTAF